MDVRGKTNLDIYPRLSGRFPMHIACLILFTLEYTSAILGHAREAREYCKTDSFEAECKQDEVIMMTYADFGRMKVGTCVTKNFGNVGCRRDVTTLVDTRCSGRRSCSLSISDQMLVRTEPCPTDFSSYLEASFDCVQVATTVQDTCSSAHHIELTGASGYIASLTTDETNCGSVQSPWVIVAQPGQRINITLYDFLLYSTVNITTTAKGSSQLESGMSSSQGSPSTHRAQYPLYCQQYARLEEKDAQRSTTVCGGDRRVKHVYTSVGHRVEVNIINKRLRSPSQYFLLHYEAVGCPEFQRPPHSYIRRDGPKLYVICNKTTETFHLKCVGNKWEGEINNCSSVPSIRADEMNNGVGLPPVGISVVIIVGVALVVVVYVAIMIICVMYLQRRKRRMRQAAAAEKMSTSELQMGSMHLLKPADSTDGLEERVPMLAKHGNSRPAVGCVTVGDYPEMQQIRTLLHTRAVDHYSTGVLGGAREAPCDCMATYGRIRPMASPRIKESIYEPSGRLHKVQCPTVPNGVKPYCELDPKGLAGSKLPNPDVVNNAKLQQQLLQGCATASDNAATGVSRSVANDNATNRIREQSL